MLAKQSPMSDSHLSRMRRCLSVCGGFIAICCTIGAGTIEKKPAAAPAAHSTHTASSLRKNPHLKGVDHSAATVKSSAHSEKHDAHEPHTVLHHIWHHRWYYHEWIAVHRGLGTIRGFVHGKGGGAMGSVRVVLRKPGGRYFARASLRHITSTDSGGNFIMFGVRAGGYRVLATKGKIKGHTQVGVHPGSTANVSIDI